MTFDWRWWSSAFPCDFSVTLPLRRERIWSRRWQLIDIKAVHKSTEERVVPEKRRGRKKARTLSPPYAPPPASAAAAAELMDYVSTEARGLWRKEFVGKNRADGAAAPPSLAAPLQEVSMSSRCSNSWLTGFDLQDLSRLSLPHFALLWFTSCKNA